eukprot:GSA25T00017833001.1
MRNSWTLEMHLFLSEGEEKVANDTTAGTSTHLILLQALTPEPRMLVYYDV